jgi:hypothetical protein
MQSIIKLFKALPIESKKEKEFMKIRKLVRFQESAF